MIKGKIIPPQFQVKDILDRTNGGYDIYRYYLGKVERLMSRPWGKKESHLSWGLFPRDGVWFWRDIASEEIGNAIHFVERYFNLSFKDALFKISSDLGFIDNRVKKVITWTAPDISDEENYCHISFIDMPFTNKHHAYWNSMEVTEQDLKKINCFAVKNLSIRRKIFKLGKDEIVFAYYSSEEDAVKIYFPERSKDQRFRNNVSYHYIWNYNNLKNEKLIIQKSFKDMAVISMIFPNVCATQAEGIKIFNDETVSRIKNISNDVTVWYGSDLDGVNKCIEITNNFGWKYINTPKDLLPNVNDASAFVQMHNKIKNNTGLKKLEEFMKLKNII